MTTDANPTDANPTDATVSAAADRLLDLLLAADPLEATLLGFRDRDAHLADLSVEREEELAAARDQIRDDLTALDASDLQPADAVTRAVVLAQIDYLDDALRAQTLDFTVAAFPVSASSILLSYLRMVVATDEEQADAYVARLAQVPRYLVQASERLGRGRAAGLTPVAHLVQMAVDQIDRFLAADPSPLLIQAPEGWEAADRWRERLHDVLERDVEPAFRAYREDLVDEVLPTARPDDRAGLVHLPDGLARYHRLVRVHTTTDRTPEDLHETGLAAVARTHAEFRDLGQRLFGITDVRAIFDHLQDDPSLRWRSAEEIVAAAEATVRRAEAAAPDWFGTVPRTACALESIPELEAEGAAPAYYMPPALDGSRPGTYFTNVNKPHDRTSFDLESVAFHEAVPGHHFQISISLEQPDLPMLRRLSLFTAYVEGWGLYSERLADEMGLYSSDLQRMGMLSADAWRAARLVVDTGLHAFGWSRQQAVDYMLANTPVAPIDVESEVDRYIAYPGQALSYMTGRLELEALRARTAARLGDRFSVAGFHDLVLGAGALPLSVLGEVVDAWAGPAD